MKYSWKGHKDRNRHKNRIKKKGLGKLFRFMTYIFDIKRNIPTTWRWARGVNNSNDENSKNSISTGSISHYWWRWRRVSLTTCELDCWRGGRKVLIMYPPTPATGKARSRLSARVTGTRQDGAAFPACRRVTGSAPWCRVARAMYGGRRDGGKRLLSC